MTEGGSTFIGVSRPHGQRTIAGRLYSPQKIKKLALVLLSGVIVCAGHHRADGDGAS